jgi:hypothetical protein
VPGDEIMVEHVPRASSSAKTAFIIPLSMARSPPIPT